MKISLPRHLLKKTRKHWNDGWFRMVSTEFNSTKSKVSSIWSESLSFASPESDFTNSSKTMSVSSTDRSDQPNWSSTLSFASPESDFVSAKVSQVESHYDTTNTRATWSERISFATPESDFVSAHESDHLSTTSSSRGTSIDSTFQEIFSAHQLYPSLESATGFIAYTEMIDDKIRQDLLKTISLKESLPKTMDDALHDERPIVITTTESPFRVVDVNDAWESLCGYRRDEAIGRNIGTLLQGPDTDVESANKMVNSLQQNGFSEITLTNYAKNGRSFKNHIRVGVLSTTSDNDAYFVGVLHDVDNHSTQKLAAL